MVIAVMSGDSSVTIVDPPPAAPQIVAGKATCVGSDRDGTFR